MSPKVHSTFWSDDDVGDLSPEHKLAFLWLITHGGTNNVGFTTVSRRDFVHNTGMPFEALDGLLKALPRAFVVCVAEGRIQVWIRHFIAHQWTPGEISQKSRIFKHLVSLAAKLPDQFRQALSMEYPALGRALEALMAEAKSEEGPCKGLEAPRAEQSRTEQNRASVSGEGAGRTNEAPSWSEVEAWGRSWPGEPASATPPVDLDWLRDWFDFRDNSATSGWDRYRDWRRLAGVDWRKQHRTWPGKKAAANGHPAKSGTWHVKQQLEAVRAAIAEHPANPRSSAYVGDGAVSAELLEDFRKKRRESAELEGRLGEA